MINSPFDFDKKTLKVAWNDPERGGNVIVERSPAEVVESPNRHRHEDILKAVCLSVAELIRIERANYERLQNLQEMMALQRTVKTEDAETTLQS